MNRPSQELSQAELIALAEQSGVNYCGDISAAGITFSSASLAKFAQLLLQQEGEKAWGVVQEDIEKMAVNRYRPVPAGVLSYKVVGGDGNRSLFSGTRDQCQIISRKLTEAFLDGAHVACTTSIAQQPTAPGGEEILQVLWMGSWIDSSKAEYDEALEDERRIVYTQPQSVAHALEKAAQVCEEQAKEPECPERAQYCADAIRALIKEPK